MNKPASVLSIIHYSISKSVKIDITTIMQTLHYKFFRYMTNCVSFKWLIRLTNFTIMKEYTLTIKTISIIYIKYLTKKTYSANLLPSPSTHFPHVHLIHISPSSSYVVTCKYPSVYIAEISVALFNNRSITSGTLTVNTIKHHRAGNMAAL